MPGTKLLILVEAASLRKLIRQITAGLAVEIWECESAHDAEVRHRNLNPNVILVDIDSEKMNGMPGIKNIRSLFPSARIIALTSFDHPDIQDSVLSSGADACLARENLLQLVRLLRWPRTKSRPFSA
jgi:DNA-binding NarL/FixJ family response regulator